MKIESCGYLSPSCWWKSFYKIDLLALSLALCLADSPAARLTIWMLS